MITWMRCKVFGSFAQDSAVMATTVKQSSTGSESEIDLDCLATARKDETFNFHAIQIFATLIFILLTVISFTATSAEAITFKPAFSAKISWLNYGVAIAILLIIALIIAKKHKPNLAKKSICQLVEKKYLSNKTVVYVIDYQRQRFLLADNQHALAIHQLNARDPDEQI